MNRTGLVPPSSFILHSSSLDSRHITGGFTARQRIALDRLWNRTE
jgi:hypothetical protein